MSDQAENGGGLVAELLNMAEPPGVDDVHWHVLMTDPTRGVGMREGFKRAADIAARHEAARATADAARERERELLKRGVEEWQKVALAAEEVIKQSCQEQEAWEAERQCLEQGLAASQYELQMLERQACGFEEARVNNLKRALAAEQAYAALVESLRDWHQVLYVRGSFIAARELLDLLPPPSTAPDASVAGPGDDDGGPAQEVEA